MTTPESKQDVPQPSYPAPGSATCQWSTPISGEKDIVCGKPAEWQKQTERGMWRLCAGHWELLIGSYNEQTQRSELCEWQPIQSPNSD